MCGLLTLKHLWAGLAELADAPDLGSGERVSCGFKSHIPHHWGVNTDFVSFNYHLSYYRRVCGLAENACLNTKKRSKTYSEVVAVLTIIKARIPCDSWTFVQATMGNK